MMRAAHITEHTAEDRVRVLSKATVEVANQLQIKVTDLGLILGISQPSASRLMAGRYQLSEKSKEWEMAVLLVRLFRSLYSIVGNNNQLAKNWLYSENSAFDNQVPLRVIQTARGLVHACDYIDAHRAQV